MREEADEFRTGLIALLPQLRRRAYRLTRDEDQAADLVQDTVARALKYQGCFAAGTELAAWLQTILRREWINGWRRREYEDAAIAETATIESARIADPSAGLLVRDLARALERLPAAQRRLVMAIDVHGMSYMAAAWREGIPKGTAQSRMSRARDELCLALEGRPRKHRQVVR